MSSDSFKYILEKFSKDYLSKDDDIWSGDIDKMIREKFDAADWFQNLDGQWATTTTEVSVKQREVDHRRELDKKLTAIKHAEKNIAKTLDGYLRMPDNVHNILAIEKQEDFIDFWKWISDSIAGEYEVQEHFQRRNANYVEVAELYEKVAGIYIKFDNRDDASLYKLRWVE